MNSFQFMWTLCDVLVEYLGIGPGDEGVMALLNPFPLLLVSFRGVIIYRKKPTSSSGRYSERGESFPFNLGVWVLDVYFSYSDFRSCSFAWPQGVRESTSGSGKDMLLFVMYIVFWGGKISCFASIMPTTALRNMLTSRGIGHSFTSVTEFSSSSSSSSSFFHAVCQSIL